jgi:leucyl-tRNA synthetase
MKYNPNEIEAKWQKYWADIKHLQHTIIQKTKTLCFRHVPYPSGAGLHVGHPLGYMHLMCIQDIKDIKGTMFCILWIR